MNELTRNDVKLTIDEQKRELRKAGRSLRDILAFGKPSGSVLGLDVSGSMATGTRDGKSRLQKLREAAFDLPPTSTILIGMLSGEPVKLVPDQSSLPETAQGGTPIAEAFLLAKENKIGHMILITDGQPNDSGWALREAEGLKVDVIYVSDPPIPQFVHDLLSKTGGSMSNIQVDSASFRKELTEKVTLLLNQGGK